MNREHRIRKGVSHVIGTPLAWLITLGFLDWARRERDSQATRGPGIISRAASRIKKRIGRPLVFAARRVFEMTLLTIFACNIWQANFRPLDAIEGVFGTFWAIIVNMACGMAMLAAAAFDAAWALIS